MKRTNIVLDEALVSQGLKLTGLKTQKDLVHYALLQLVRRESQLGLLKLRGGINWDGEMNPTPRAEEGGHVLPSQQASLRRLTSDSR